VFGGPRGLLDWAGGSCWGLDLSRPGALLAVNRRLGPPNPQGDQGLWVGSRACCKGQKRQVGRFGGSNHKPGAARLARTVGPRVPIGGGRNARTVGSTERAEFRCAEMLFVLPKAGTPPGPGRLFGLKGDIGAAGSSFGPAARRNYSDQFPYRGFLDPAVRSRPFTKIPGCGTRWAGGECREANIKATMDLATSPKQIRHFRRGGGLEYPRGSSL